MFRTSLLSTSDSTIQPSLLPRNGGAAAEMFWKMSTESTKHFFDSLKMLETKSLNLTLKVPKERQELEAALQVLPSKKSRVSCSARCLDMAGSIQGPERRIVLVGKMISGKSATGNTILGSEVFKSGCSPLSITEACQKEETQLKGRKVVVVDTPGFFHTHRPEKEIAAQVSKCVKFCSPGPHVILHVMHPFHASQKETDGVQLIKKIFGRNAKDYTIILFTHKDSKEGQSLENVISSRNKKVKKYIAECRNRCLTFNNKAEGEEREAQVAELMAMIDTLVEMNRCAPCYMEDMMNFK
ncbi:hypothetical protein E2320_014151 [Naja naja]|nr:hypothetical protein E2320_014151 [Naja naja]